MTLPWLSWELSERRWQPILWRHFFMLSSQLGNSVFHQISAANLHALQYFLNAAARLVMRKRKYDHITARRLTLAAYSAAGNVKKTVHHRPQMPTRSSSTIPVRTVYSSLHQRWTSFPAFSNIWRSARAKDVNVNIWTSQFRRLRT